MRQITPDELRAARALLGWSKHRLAARSKVTLHFIQQFETTGRTTTMLWRPQGFNGLAAIRAALEADGIAFMDSDQLVVRLARIVDDKSPGVHITPQQMRAARMLLGWSRERLAVMSETTTTYIRNFENLGRIMKIASHEQSFDALDAIRVTLTDNGIEFFDNDESGVKLKHEDESDV